MSVTAITMLLKTLVQFCRRSGDQNQSQSGISLICFHLLAVAILSLCLQPVVSVIEERGKNEAELPLLITAIVQRYRCLFCHITCLLHL